MNDANLNLLPILVVLLEEQSVTRAAERLGLSSPTVSRALRELRMLLSDPLLVRAGSVLVPTARASALRPELERWLTATGQLLQPPSLDPALLDQKFVIHANEDLAGILAGRLAGALAEIAPRVTLSFGGEQDLLAAMRSGLVHMALGADLPSGPELQTSVVFRDSYVAILRADHPLLDGVVTAEDLLAQRYVTRSRFDQQVDPVDASLQARGLRRTIVLHVPSASAAIAALVESDLVTTAPSRLAQTLRERGHSIRTIDWPFPVEPFVLAMQWHPRNGHDAACRWLRALITDIFRQIRARTAS